jgi:hypothetical protein
MRVIETPLVLSEDNGVIATPMPHNTNYQGLAKYLKKAPD